TTLTKTCGTDPNFVMCDADRERENPEIDKDTNRIEELQPDGDQDEDYEFDEAGNMTLDPDGRQFFYDGENKQIAVKDISDNIIGEYVYDGDGRRVMKKVPLGGGIVETTVFVYDAGGKLVAEYSTTVASQSTAQVSYLTHDHLGSPRITTDKNGKVYSRRDFLPFGEDLDINVTAERTSAIGYGPDTVRQEFTGYERDEEIGLDYAIARMYSSSLSRFTTPDPSLISFREGSPQTWNRFSYTQNNPLRFVDPLGLYICEGSDAKCEEFDKSLQRARENLKKLKKRYGEDSDEYKEADRSLSAYGERGVDNKVLVQILANRPADMRSEGRVKGDKDKNGNVVAQFLETAVSDQALVGHEGSHIDDKAENRSRSNYEKEFAALSVHFSLLEAEHHEPSSSFTQVSKPYVLALPWGDSGSVTFFDSNWVRSTRVYGDNYQLEGVQPRVPAEVKKKAIDEVLAVPKSKGGLYGLTPPK
ncbi:MAG: RHS repeat-associated core domain-containing protein, partial [Aridibacter famidurans]|nr:RHS repeat-associated core domain-containing protein [Aridibacter famidurans]